MAGSSRTKKTKFQRISWTSDNVKTLGIHHGYNIDDNEIWKIIIEKMKNCVHVWKSRNLTYTGKTLIVKNSLITLCGYEVEIRGVPEKFKKEINDLIWNFVWGGKVNQIDRNVRCLEVKKGGMGMINFEFFIESKSIKLLYRIINEPIQSWNAIAKFWLRKLDQKYNEQFFICKCSNDSNFNLNFLPAFYRKAIQAWSKMLKTCQSVITRDDILNQYLIGNSNLVFQNKSLIFSSFAKSGIKTVRDVWDDDTHDFIRCNDVFSKLIDKRNCIAEYSRIKKSIPKKFISVLRHEQINEDNVKGPCTTISNELQFVMKSNKVIEPKNVTLKLIQNILNKEITPKCQIKWEEIYGENDIINWYLIWNNLRILDINNSVKEFQWKCLHNIVYTEFRLKKMNLSDGKCHFCRSRTNLETLSHLFFSCNTANTIVTEIKNLGQRSNVEIVDLDEKRMMLGYNEGEESDFVKNVIIFFSKWSIWKIRNQVKFNKRHASLQEVKNIWKRELKSNIQILLLAKCNKTIDKEKLTEISDNLN